MPLELILISKLTLTAVQAAHLVQTMVEEYHSVVLTHGADAHTKEKVAVLV